MLQVVRAGEPNEYPTIEQALAKAALWTAFPTALISRTGKVLAANKLASWIAGLRPAREMLGRDIIELSAQLIMREQRIPYACNVPFIRKKMENLEHIDPHGRSPLHLFFRNLLETAKAAPTPQVRDAACPMFHSVREFDERTPWQYPLRMQSPGRRNGKDLLEFAVIEARLRGETRFIIVLEPDNAVTAELVGDVYDRHEQLFPGEDYAVAQAGIDIKLPRNYTHDDLHKPKIEIVDIGQMRNIEELSLSQPSLSGGPIFELRPRQTLAPQDIGRICTAIDAEHVPLPAHPELGPGDGFRLKTDAAPGRVTQVDVYLRRPAEDDAAVRVHRVDDLGEPHAPRYVFHVGHLHEGESQALVFRSVRNGRARAVTVYRSGEFGEDPGATRPIVAVGPATEEKPMSAEQLPSTLTIRQAAEVLGIGRTAVLSAIERRRLTARKVAGRWLIDRAGLEAYRQSISHRRAKPGPRSGRPTAA